MSTRIYAIRWQGTGKFEIEEATATIFTSSHVILAEGFPSASSRKLLPHSEVRTASNADELMMEEYTIISIAPTYSGDRAADLRALEHALQQHGWQKTPNGWWKPTSEATQ